MADDPSQGGLSPKASLTIALAGIAATLVAAFSSSWLTGHQQASLQDKNLAAQANAFDKRELRGVVDEAASALLRAQAEVTKIEEQSGARRVTQYAVARASVEATQLPEARLTVRLGALHPITRAYRLARRALSAQYDCTVRTGSVPAIRRYLNAGRQATSQFDSATTELLGSAVSRGRGPHGVDRHQLDRLEKALNNLKPNCS